MQAASITKCPPSTRRSRYPSFPIESRRVRQSTFAARLATDLNLDDGPIRASTTSFAWALFHDVALLRFASKSCNLKYKAGAFRDFYLLKIQKAGQTAIRLDDRQLLIGPGEVVLCDGAASHEYDFDDDNEHLCLVLPKALLASRLRRSSLAIGDMVNHRIESHRSTAVIMRSCAIGLIGQIGALNFIDQEPLAGRVLGDTIISCFSAEFDGLKPDDDKWEIVRKFIAANLEDPTLRPGVICRELRISSKVLQCLFRLQGTSCHKFIANARLEEACRRLRDPILSTSITEVAFDVGFDDLSYFSRSFRQKYGLPAREYRRSALIAC